MFSNTFLLFPNFLSVLIFATPEYFDVSHNHLTGIFRTEDLSQWTNLRECFFFFVFCDVQKLCWLVSCYCCCCGCCFTGPYIPQAYHALGIARGQ